MPLPMMADVRGYVFDKELELRDIADGAETGTASETAIEFPVRKIDLYKCIVYHSAIGGTIDGSNYWTVTVEVSDAVGGTYTQVATTGPLTATAKEIELPLSGLNATWMDADSGWIRVTATETGATAGNLTYGAYLTK